MEKKWIMFAGVLLFAGLLMGAVEAKKKPIKPGDFFVYQKTADARGDRVWL